jgi:hypothetical protein
MNIYKSIHTENTKGEEMNNEDYMKEIKHDQRLAREYNMGTVEEEEKKFSFLHALWS